jgi:hypothetical protein
MVLGLLNSARASGAVLTVLGISGFSMATFSISVSTISTSTFSTL